jgi:chromate transporter
MAALLIAFGFGAAWFNGIVARGVLHGLQLLAVAVVAQAVLGMARRLTPDIARAAIALGAAVIVLMSRLPMAQLLAIVLGAALGWLICRSDATEPLTLPASAVTPRAGWIAWTLFLLLFAAVFAIPERDAPPALALFGAFYKSGSLVFGGGHVVLPLLHDAFVTPGWVSDQAFMSGYGAAQAVPGPLFTFAAYLGSITSVGPRGISGALIGLAGIFLPGLLLLVGALPHWQRLRQQSVVKRCLLGVNAAVVGLLAAALYRPIWTGSVGTLQDVLLVVLCFALLISGRVPVLLVALVAAIGGFSGVRD